MSIQEDNFINKDMKNFETDRNMPEANLMTDEQVAHIAAGLLNESAQHLNAVTLHRLSVARGLAINKLATSQGFNQSGGVLQWLGHSLEQHRLMSAAIIAGAMLLTFFVVQQFKVDHHLKNSDAFLLASELPPEAFADKGFDTWLVSKRD
ncbi:MAG: DUF3619 family protein [Methylotenera sp.]|nr:DUF3619 family protein [Methylotenera sp.]